MSALSESICVDGATLARNMFELEGVMTIADVIGVLPVFYYTDIAELKPQTMLILLVDVGVASIMTRCL